MNFITLKIEILFKSKFISKTTLLHVAQMVVLLVCVLLHFKYSDLS